VKAFGGDDRPEVETIPKYSCQSGPIDRWSASPGVVDTAMHLLIEPLDVLCAKAPNARWQLDCANQAGLFPAAKRVLVDAETSSRFADAQ
jgi:hypothetical protein